MIGDALRGLCPSTVLALMVAVLMSLTSCVRPQCEAVEVNGAHIDCFYDGQLVASGELDVHGQALSDVLEGTWSVINHEKVWCQINVGTSTSS